MEPTADDTAGAGVAMTTSIATSKTIAAKSSTPPLEPWGDQAPSEVPARTTEPPREPAAAAVTQSLSVVPSCNRKQKCAYVSCSQYTARAARQIRVASTKISRKQKPFRVIWTTNS